jgi:hypothetical protein
MGFVSFMLHCSCATSGNCKVSEIIGILIQVAFVSTSRSCQRSGTDSLPRHRHRDLPRWRSRVTRRGRGLVGPPMTFSRLSQRIRRHELFFSFYRASTRWGSWRTLFPLFSAFSHESSLRKLTVVRQILNPPKHSV